MNILVLSNYHSSINVVRPEAEIFIGLQKRGHHVTIVSHPDSEYRQRFVEHGLRFVDGTPSKKHDPVFIETIRQEIAEGQYDIVHAFNSKTIRNAIRAVGKSGPQLVTYRGVTGGSPWYDPTSYLTHLHPRVDAITCVSQSAAHYLRKQLRRKDKVFQFYKGHDLSWYEGVEKIDRSSIGVGEEAVMGIAVANIRKMKGLKYLIKATYELGDLDQFHLVLVGGGMNKPRFKKLINQSPIRDRIHILGQRDDALSLIKSSDFLILPSIKSEGLPKVIIEAMVQEVPPIATSVGGSPELIENRKSGLIIDKKSPSAIADGVRWMITHPKEASEMGRQARRRISLHFNAEQAIDQLEKAYHQICNLR